MSQSKAAFVVIAEFAVSEEHRTEFLELCRFDSERSTTDEPGCRQFDVSTLEDDPRTVVLYEIYDDRAAFDYHLTTPHFVIFAEGLERMGVQTTVVRFFQRQHP